MNLHYISIGFAYQDPGRKISSRWETTVAQGTAEDARKEAERTADAELNESNFGNFEIALILSCFLYVILRTIEKN